MEFKSIRNPYRRFKKWLHGIYSCKRDSLFTTDPARFGFDSSLDSKLYGVVIDFGCEYETITVAVFMNGSAKRYTCGKTGLLRSWSLTTKAELANDVLQMAEKYLSYMHASGPMPIPEVGNVNFQALTGNGIYSVAVTAKSIEEGFTEFEALYILCWSLAKALEPSIDY